MYIKKIEILGTNRLATNLTTRNFNFEALVDGNKVYVLDKNNNLISINSLKNNYQIFTYNNKNQEYIMKPTTGPFRRINNYLEEIDEFKIKTPNIKTNNIKDIYFDEDNNHYLVVEDRKIYSITQDGKYLKNEVNNQDFYIVKEENICSCKKDIIPRDFMYTAVASSNTGKIIAYTKNNSTYLALVSKNGSKVDEVFLGDNLKVNSLVLNNGIFANATNGTTDFLYEISTTSSGGGIEPEVQDIISILNALIEKISFTESQIGTLIQTEASKLKKILEESTDLNLILQTNTSISAVIAGLANVELGERDNLNLVLQAIMELQNILTNNN